MNPTVVILCGGIGSRLRSVHAGPKCLASVCGRPFISHLLAKLQAQGISRLVLSIAYGGEEVRSYISASGWRARFQMLDFITDRSDTYENLGKARAVHRTLQLYADSLIVINGDTLADVDLFALYSLHLNSGLSGMACTVNPPVRSDHNVNVRDGIAVYLPDKSVTATHTDMGAYVIGPSASDALMTASNLEAYFCSISRQNRLLALTCDGLFVHLNEPMDLRDATALIASSYFCHSRSEVRK